MPEGQSIIHERGSTVKIAEVYNRDKFYDKVIKRIDAQKKGEGMTKLEVVRIQNFKNPTTADKWMRESPGIRERCIYIHTNGGRNRTAIFVPLRDKAELIKNGTATESY